MYDEYYQHQLELQALRAKVSVEDYQYARGFDNCTQHAYWNAVKVSQPANLNKENTLQRLKPFEIIGSYTPDLKNTKTQELAYEESKYRQHWQQKLLSHVQGKKLNLKESQIENLIRGNVLSIQVRDIRRKLLLCLFQTLETCHISDEIECSPSINDLITGLKACEHMELRETKFACTVNNIEPTNRHKYNSIMQKRRDDIILHTNTTQKNERFANSQDDITIDTSLLHALQRPITKRQYNKNYPKRNFSRRGRGNRGRGQRGRSVE